MYISRQKLISTKSYDYLTRVNNLRQIPLLFDSEQYPKIHLQLTRISKICKCMQVDNSLLCTYIPHW